MVPRSDANCVTIVKSSLEDEAEKSVFGGRDVITKREHSGAV
jgi:hypothetical protein